MSKVERTSSIAASRGNAYKKVTLLEHVLLRAETYVGSKQPETMSLYVPESDGEKIHMTLKEVTFVPAFFKIFDEIIVNAADNKNKALNKAHSTSADNEMKNEMKKNNMKSNNNSHVTDTIKVNIDAEKGEISVENNGRGIPVVLHDKEKIYVPELIFGHLLTGSNYDDDEKRVTGGRNGYGAKLTNIYSTEFQIETHDSIEGKTYKQKWTDNMSKWSSPKITTSAKKKDMTKVTFKPDLDKLNMNSIDSDTLDVLKKRVYDLTGSLSGVKVFLNGERIKINNFKDYISTYLVNESEEKPKIVHERFSDRWEVAVALSDTGAFQQVSFVNSIATTKGGTHVNYVTDQIVSHITDLLKKKDGNISVKPAQIRNQLFVFVNCLVENPTFEGQVKEFMTLRPNKYGSICAISETFMKKVAKLGIVETTLEMIREKDEARLKKTDGTKRSRLSGITNLHDANNAGTRKAKDCTLFVVEGESAASFALSGIPVVKNGRDVFGTYPLRGKLLNVREASARQKLENKEIGQLKQILGLQEGKTYTSLESLRYGHICILTDADVDGTHIKGLILNWLESSFPSLLKIPGFLLDFATPIVKCTRGHETILFYTKRDYDEWKEKTNGGKGWKPKYFKGLGTSKADDVKKYFSSLDNHLKRFRELDDDDSEHLDLVFSKKRASDRKRWLQRYDKNNTLDEAQKIVPISDFIDKEFITFSMYDNIRSIPSMVDGLKPGQRKILYTAFKKLNDEVKVAQFAAKVAELTEYRHGEQSLGETIIGMAQGFVGANNIPLLQPEGQFGTRRNGGKDAAATRYIFTRLHDITRKIFRPSDDTILNHLVEDGKEIEPEYYVPIIPMVLVNGAEGIGSGYSTTVLNHNPRDIIDLLLARIDQVETGNIQPFPANLTPWYKGFTGTVEAIGEDDAGNAIKWMFTGVVKRKNTTTMEVLELPIEMWTGNYKEFLEDKVSKGEIKDYKEYHTDNTVHFTIQASQESLDALMASPAFYKNYKLITTKYTSNMMLFSPTGKLRHYANVGEIMEDFYVTRVDHYEKRKNRLLAELGDDLKWATNKSRFIQAVIDDSLVVMKRKRNQVVDDLAAAQYDKKDDSYDYLLNMPIHTLTKEKVSSLASEVVAIEKRIDSIQRTSKEQMYREELVALQKSLAL